MVIVLLASGFEELEAITPVDILRRNNIDVRTVSITNEKLITGTHGIQMAADLIASDVPLDGIDMLVLPGGMPGVKNLDASPITKIFIDATLKNGGRLAAICAAPSIFGRHGMLTNIKATCFPGFEADMLNAILTDKDVVTDGVFTTARDFKSAGAFAEELVKICDKMGIKPHDENEEALDFEETAEEDEVIDLEAILKSFAPLSEDDFDFESEEENAEEVDLSDINLGNVQGDQLDEVQQEANTIINVLSSFNVNASIRSIDRGPRITRYEIVPARGVKVNAVTNLANDISLLLGKEGIRMIAPIPGKAAIGLEVPNSKPEVVSYKEMLEYDEYKNAASTVVPIGKDVAGNPVFYDLTKFPHAIVCGATGMGKSVFINSILTSLISKSSPEELKLILIDPKKVEFTPFKDIPHLLTPVITEHAQMCGALRYAIEEMERRYELFEKLKVRNIEAYNEKVKLDVALDKPFAKIVIVIDELADLMMLARDPAEDYIMRLAQKARAAGIHLVIGTQRPSVNVLTATIKANIPTRIVFKVTSQIDSRTILDSSGAEKLLNRGDMLFRPVSMTSPIRAQSSFISDSEVEERMDEIRLAEPSYDSDILNEINEYAEKLKKERASVGSSEGSGEEAEEYSYFKDQTFLDAVELAVNAMKISTSFLQRKLSIGYGKAAKFIDAMEEMGIVSEPDGQKPRTILITLEEWHEKLAKINID